LGEPDGIVETVNWSRSLQLLLIVFSLLWFSTAAAHEIKPVVVNAALQDATTLRWEMRLNLEASLAGIDAKHDDTDDDPNTVTYNQLRALSASELVTEFEQQADDWLKNVIITNGEGLALLSSLVSINVEDGDNESVARDTLLVVDTEFPAASVVWAWQWQGGYAPTIVRYDDASNPDQNVAHYVNSGDLSPTISVREPQSTASVGTTFWNFIKLGFVHIIPKGLDHIVFVLGVVLLLPQLKPVAWQVTLFTIAHSITLGLAMVGTISLPATLVESCIALSIVYIGFDNLKASAVGIFRMLSVFAFGLLHGLGFASVLSELGTNNNYPWVSLAGFNVGVELGQLIVVALFFLFIGWWTRHQRWYGSVVRIPLSLLLSAVGLWWFVERIT